MDVSPDYLESQMHAHSGPSSTKGFCFVCGSYIKLYASSEQITESRNHISKPLCVSGITSQDQFHTSILHDIQILQLQHMNYCGILHCPFIVIDLGEQYSNYRKFVK